MQPAEIPAGRYLTCTWVVRIDSGGQTKALLMRNRLLHEAGVQPWILSFVPIRNLTEVRQALLEKGQLLPGTRLEGIYDYYRERGWSGEESAESPLAGLGKHAVRREHRPDGTPWRTTYRLGPMGATVFDYQRDDGSTYLRIPAFSFTDQGTWPDRIQQVSPSGTVVGRFASLGDWFRAWVREIVDGERAFVFLEARVLTPHLVPMADQNVHLIQVMHSVHLGGIGVSHRDQLCLFVAVARQVDGLRDLRPDVRLATDGSASRRRSTRSAWFSRGFRTPASTCSATAPAATCSSDTSTVEDCRRRSPCTDTTRAHGRRWHAPARS